MFDVRVMGSGRTGGVLSKELAEAWSESRSLRGRSNHEARRFSFSCPAL